MEKSTKKGFWYEMLFLQKKNFEKLCSIIHLNSNCFACFLKQKFLFIQKFKIIKQIKTPQKVFQPNLT